MAKALYGHMASTDARLLAEVQRLRNRVADLEAEVLRLKAETSLETSFFSDEFAVDLPADLREPAQV